MSIKKYKKSLFPQKLKNIRQINNLSREEFAQILGFKTANRGVIYGKIERGDGNLTIKQAVILSKQFDINLNWLLRDEGDMLLGGGSFELPTEEKESHELVLEMIEELKRREELQSESEVAGVLGMSRANLHSFKVRGRVPVKQLGAYCKKQGIELKTLLASLQTQKIETSKEDVVSKKQGNIEAQAMHEKLLNMAEKMISDKEEMLKQEKEISTMKDVEIERLKETLQNANNKILQLKEALQKTESEIIAVEQHTQKKTG